MAKTDYLRTPDGPQRIIDTNLKVSGAFAVPLITGAITIGDNPDEAGYLLYKNGLQLYGGSSIGWNQILTNPAAGDITKVLFGDQTWKTLNTSVVPEGTNLYYTAARFNTDFAAKTTADLAEGTNKYYTDARVQTFGDTRYEPILAAGTTLQYYAGDKTWKTLIDGTGKIVSSLLPSYVDDVVEVTDLAALPGTGETGKIYVTLDTNFEYRWSGSTYIRLVASPGSTDAVPEGSLNLYYTNARVDARVATLGYVPYTGATTYLDLGAHDIIAQDAVINGNILTNKTNGGLIRLLTGGADVGKIGTTNSVVGSGANNDLVLQVATGASTPYRLLLGSTEKYSINSFGQHFFTGDVRTSTYVYAQQYFFSGNLFAGPDDQIFGGSSGNAGINVTGSSRLLRLGVGGTVIGEFSSTGLKVSNGSYGIVLGSNPSLGITGGIWDSQVTPTANNGALYTGSTVTQLNGVSAVEITINGTGGASLDINGFSTFGFLEATSYPAGVAGTDRILVQGATGGNYGSPIKSISANSYIQNGTSLQASTNLNIDGLATITKASIGTTPTDALLLTNTTAATSGNQQYSPALHFISQGWQTGTGASQVYDTRIYGAPTQSSTGTNNLNFDQQTASGGYITSMSLSPLGLQVGSAANAGAVVNIGFGSSLNTSRALNVGTVFTSTASSAVAVNVNATFSTAATVGVSGFSTSLNLNTGTSTFTTVTHYSASFNTLGGNTITTQNGFLVTSTLTQATNNYGFRGALAAATGRYNIYMDGTALNYINGNLQLGSTIATAGAEKLQVTGTASISSTLLVGGTITANSILPSANNTYNLGSSSFRYGTLYAINADVSGTATINNLLASGTSGHTISNTSSAGDVNILNIIAPNTPAGSDTYMVFGAATGTNNSLVMNFNYVGNASTSNFVQFGLYGSGTPQLRIYDGRIGLPNIGTFSTPGSYYFLTLNSSNGYIEKVAANIPVSGQATLVAGVATITISGLTTSSIAVPGFVIIGGTVSTTWQYKVVCTTNTLTITAITNAGTTNTSDTSTISYIITP